MDTPFLNILLGDNPDVITYLNELFRTKRPEQQSSTFWLPTPKNSGKNEDQTPIQKRILNDLNDLKKEGTLNLIVGAVSTGNYFLERMDWTKPLLAELEKQAVENLLVDEYHDNFAKGSMDVGIDKNFKMNLTPKLDRAVYCQSLPKLTYLKNDLIVELAQKNKYGTFTVLFLSNYARPFSAQKKPKGKLRLIVDLRRITNLIADDYTNT